MLWQEQFVPGSQNLPPLVRRYRGRLDVDALGASLTEIVRRHEPLRTTFELGGGRPVQVVSPPAPVDLAVRDLGGLATGDREIELARTLESARRPFDLVSGPLFEPTLLRLGPEDHVLVFRVHHSVYDDWSVGVFRRELSALYAAFVAGDPSPLPELPVRFSDFSRAHRRRLAGHAGAVQLSYWREQLASAPLGLELPIDDPDRPQGAPQDSAEPVSLEIPPGLVGELRALARNQRATVFMAMLAAFQVVVRHYTGEEELLLASVVANRNRTELEGMVGCFTKKILLRHSVAGDPSFVEVLARTRAAVLGALPHQDLPFETVLQSTLGPAAAAHGLVPNVAVMFQGVTPQADDLVLPGVATSGYETSSTATRTHFAAGAEEARAADAGTPWGGGLYLGTFLILSVDEASDGISLVARGAFHRAGVERLLATYRTALAQVVAHPSRPVSELCLLDDEQRAELARWNATAEDLPVDRRVDDVFSEQLARTPSAVAVVGEDGAITFAELDARAASLASRLSASGVQPGALVGACLERPEDAVVAFLAVWKAGAGCVALDPRDDDDRLASMVESAAIEVVVTAAGNAPRALDARARLVAVDAGGQNASSRPREVHGQGSGETGAALVFYGSGPSQVPEGVVIDHRSVVNLLAGLRRTVYDPAVAEAGRPLRVCLSAHPTDDAFIRQVVALLDGHTLHALPIGGGGDGRRSGPRAVVSLIADGEVDLVDTTPAEMGALAGEGLREALDRRRGAAPVLQVGARAPIGGDLWNLLRTLPARAHLFYGTPECGFAATEATVSGSGPRPTIGRPMANVECHVLSSSGTPVPVGATGELHVGGAGLAAGHLAGERATTERSVPRSLAGSRSARLLRTRQLARYLPDGRVQLLGPAEHLVGFRGFRVDLSRIEAVLRRCPGVAEVRVAAGDDSSGVPRLVAHVRAGDGPAPTLARLRLFLWGEMPGYAWPAKMVLVGGGAEVEGPTGDGDVPLAATLAAAWADVVGVERIGAEENYWQSFSFLEAVTRAREAGAPVNGRQVSRNRSVTTLGVDATVETGRRPASGPGGPA